MIKTHSLNNRIRYKKTAEETMRILEQGYYDIGEERYKIKEIVDWSIKNAKHYKPKKLQKMAKKDYRGDQDTLFTVENVDSFSAACGTERPLVLNFASGKHPGGGFLKGAQAQEECLSRASTLYPTISQMSKVYSAHRKERAPFYSDHMIYSPGVLVFRDETGGLMDRPFKTAVITSPSVNIGYLKTKSESLMKMVQERMVIRSINVLSVAADNKHKNLILGAWGSGVFGLPPGLMPNIFKYLLETKFKGAFEEVTFAVLDTSKEEYYIGPFKKVFGG